MDEGGAEEGAKPEPTALRKQVAKIASAMKRVKAKKEQKPAPPAPSRKQAKLKTQMKKAKEAAQHKRERKSAIAKQRQHRAMKAGGDAVQAHLAKLKTISKKRVTSRHAMLGMASEGELLVRAYLRHGQKSSAPRSRSQAGVPASPSSRKASAAKDAAKVDKYKAKKLAAKAKAAKAQARRNDKFEGVLREQRRIARQKFAKSKKRAARAKGKARGAKAKVKLLGKRAVSIAAGKAKIAAQGLKLAKYQLKWVNSKLKLAKYRSRSARAQRARNVRKRIRAKTNVKKLATKAKIERRKIRTAKRLQRTEIRQAQQASKLKSVKKAEIKQRAKVSRLKRKVVRETKKMLGALKKSKKGRGKALAKFEKMRSEVAKNKARLGHAKHKARTDQRKVKVTVVGFAKKAVKSANRKRKAAAVKLTGARQTLKRSVTAAKRDRRVAQRQMKLALQSGSKKQAKEALHDLKKMAKNAKHRARETRRLENDKVRLKTDARTLRSSKRALRKDEKAESKKQSHSMSAMMARVKQVEKASSKAARRASGSETIIRMQAEAESRRQLRKIASEGKALTKLRSRSRASEAAVSKLNRRARRIAKKYTVLVKAAGVASGSKIKSVTNRVAKALGKLDTADRTATKRQQAYQQARSKLQRKKAAAKNAIHTNMKVIRKKVQRKVQALKVKKKESSQKQTKKMLMATHGPRKWLLVAQIHSRKARKKMNAAEAMLDKAQSGLRHQQLRLKHVKSNAAKTQLRVKIKKMKGSVRHWSTRVARARRTFRRSKKLVNKREDGVHAARAVYKGSKALEKTELRRTTALMKKANDAGAAHSVALARKVTKLALAPGGSAAVRAVIDKAMRAENAGASQNSALKYITRKLTTPPKPRLKEAGGMSRMEYDAQREAMQSLDVTSGRYGQHAENMLAQELKRVDAGGDPDTPRRGMSREQLRAAERKDLRGLKKAGTKVPLVKRLVPTARKAGLSKYQYDASAAAIHDTRVRMGVPESDKRDQEKADRRVRKVKRSWKRYQKTMKSMKQHATQQRGDDTAKELLNTKASHRAGLAHFEKEWKKLPILP